MANDYQKLFFAVANGLAKKIAATSSPGDTLATATADNTGNIMDEFWLYAYNSDTVARELVIQWGGTTSPDNDIKITLPAKSGIQCVVPGLPLNNSLVVKAYCTTTNVITVYGYGNRITHS